MVAERTSQHARVVSRFIVSLRNLSKGMWPGRPLGSKVEPQRPFGSKFSKVCLGTL